MQKKDYQTLAFSRITTRDSRDYRSQKVFHETFFLTAFADSERSWTGRIGSYRKALKEVHSSFANSASTGPKGTLSKFGFFSWPTILNSQQTSFPSFPFYFVSVARACGSISGLRLSHWERSGIQGRKRIQAVHVLFDLNGLVSGLTKNCCSCGTIPNCTGSSSSL